MKRTMLIAAVLIVIVGAGSVFAKPVEQTGDISSVIVYRGQALITRTISAELPKGSSELIVGSLPEKIVPESLYCQGTGDIKILSVRYREKAIKKDTREEVKKLDAQIEQTSRKLKHAEDQRLHYGIIWEKYDPFWKLTADSAKGDLDRALLQFEPIEQLTGYLEGKLNDLYEKRSALTDTIDNLKKELGSLNRRRGKLKAARSRSQRQAVIFLNKTSNKKSVVELNYLVNNANWSPQYNLRSKPNKSTVTIEYNAIVHQSSGEDWNNAELALSTAQPSLVASSPLLEAMEIDLTETPTRYSRRPLSEGMPGMAGKGQLMQQAEQVQYIDRSDDFQQLIQRRKSNISFGRTAQIALNSIAFDNQMLEFEADKKEQKQMTSQMRRIARTEGVSVMYKVPGKLSLPSRSDQQLLTIATISADAEFTLLATPLLTDYVYLQAKILNDSDTILLPGSASMYRNGEFVGKGRVNLVTIGQDFTAGFGIDSQVQVTREFKDKKIETLWGNRIDDHKYEIRIDNYKDTAVKLRLLERLPYTENPNIEITLSQPSHKLSDAQEYQQTERKKGILRWDLNLKPNSTGSKATVLSYGFTMKYDNDMHITTAKKAR